MDLRKRKKDYAISKDTKEEERPVTLLVDKPSKWKGFFIRTVSTLSMIFGAIFIVYFGGHWGFYLLTIGVKIVIFKEVISLGYKQQVEAIHLPYFRTLMWLFLFSTLFFIHGANLSSFLVRFRAFEYLAFVAQYHTFISYCLHMSVFVLFVMSLKKGVYKYQFKQFAWTHMALLFIIGPGTLYSRLILKGLIWYLTPICLIVLNDVFAYICGFFFGRTPLIKLSPKKTWEGFIGASFFTLVGAFLGSIWLYPIQLHSLLLATFASIIAPFGGFFASGFKRAFKIKDFGNSIPGHGGATDRFDCHLVMGLFCFMHYTYVVRNQVYNPEAWLSIVSAFTSDQQMELYDRLKDMLLEKGILNSTSI